MGLNGPFFSIALTVTSSFPNQGQLSIPSLSPLYHPICICIYISLLPDLTVRNLRPGIQLSNNKCFKEERKEGGRGGYTVTLSAKEAETQRD